MDPPVVTKHLAEIPFAVRPFIEASAVHPEAGTDRKGFVYLATIPYLGFFVNVQADAEATPCRYSMNEAKVQCQQFLENLPPLDKDRAQMSIVLCIGIDGSDDKHALLLELGFQRAAGTDDDINVTFAEETVRALLANVDKALERESARARALTQLLLV